VDGEGPDERGPRAGPPAGKDGIEIVTLESTSDYWRIWLFVLEACGLAIQLVSASQAKNLPGWPKRPTSWMPCCWPD